MIGLLPELRYALRQVRKSPGFAATTILTLTFAIGVATAIFSVLYAVLVRPLPYKQQERIVSVQTYSRDAFVPASYPEYVSFRRENRTFQALAAVQPYETINLESTAGAVVLNKVEASDNFFDVFGVAPILGRAFLPGEDQPGRNNSLVLSYEVWQRNFGSRTDVIGQTAKLDGSYFVIVGVMPAGFRYPLSVQNAVYMPLHVPPQFLTKNHWLQTVARLKPDTSLKQAQAELDRMIANLTDAGQLEKGRRIWLEEMASATTTNLHARFRLLVLAVLAVLAIGCANIAGLLLARGIKREHEIALRLAVGASKGCIVRQLLTETFLLSIAGAAGAVLLAYGLLQMARIFLASTLARGMDVQIDSAALLAALGLALLTTLLSGLLPALRLSSIAPNPALKISGSAGSSRSQQRLRAAFVIIQLGLAFSLLIASGLTLRSLARLLHTDIGFPTDQILTIDVSPARANYEKRDIIAGLYDPLIEKVRTIPGVQDAGMIQMLPVRQSGTNSDVHIVGQPPDPPNQQRWAEARWVTTGYFNALGLRLVRGRILDASIDTFDSRPTATVVNEAFVQKFFARGEDPIGRQVDNGDDKFVIVGIVSSVRQVLSDEPLPEMDFLISQVPPAERAHSVMLNLCMVIRTHVTPTSLIPGLRHAFYEIDPSLPIGEPKTMRQIVSDSLLMERFQNWVYGTFAALALALSIVGLYGLISQDILLSTRDIGVRMALGASRGKTFAAIYRRVSLLLGGGLSAGLLITFFLKRVLATVVLISPGKDSGLILGLAAGLFGVGLLATFFPALRASQINPMTAMRYE